MQAIPVRTHTARRLGTRGATLMLALAAGLAAALLAFLVVRGHLATPATAAVPISVVVAARDIPARTRLTAGMLQVRRVAPADVLTGAVLSSSNAVGQITVQPIGEGAAVTSDSITPPSAALGMAFALPPSLRAVTVATDPADGVELFVRPGDHVDILATDDPGSGPAEARTALQNVRLLAVGSQTASDDSTTSASSASSAGATHVTLAVTPAQAQTLVLAAARGKIHLALRAVDDSSVAALPATPASKIASINAPARPVPVHPKPPKTVTSADDPLPLPPLPVALPPAPATVTIIKGTVSQTVTVTP